jgi:hypothetical protein
MKDSEIAHNRFERTQMGKADEFYGIKVRQGKRCRVHHNTIEVNFSMEFPFENDEDIEIDEPYPNFNIRNNHIITRTTKTPRTEGLFGFNSKCDFATMTIRDNVIECLGQSRPLLRTDEISGALNENNRLRNVSDTDRYKNEQSNRPAGLEEPLKFECGVYGEFLVDGWDSRTASLLQLRAGRRRRYSRRSKLSRDRHRRRSNRHLSLNNRHLS